MRQVPVINTLLLLLLLVQNIGAPSERKNANKSSKSKTPSNSRWAGLGPALYRKLRGGCCRRNKEPKDLPSADVPRADGIEHLHEVTQAASPGYPVFHAGEEPSFTLDFPLPNFVVEHGPPEAHQWSARQQNMPRDGNSLFRAVALSLEANDFYDFSRDPFSLFYRRHSQLRRAATQVLILLSRKASDVQFYELVKLIFGDEPTEELAHKFQKHYDNTVEAYAREVTAIDKQQAGHGEVQALAVYLRRPIAVIMASTVMGRQRQHQQQQSNGDGQHAEEEIIQVYLPDLTSKKHTVPANGRQLLWELYSYPIVVYHDGKDHFQAVYCKELMSKVSVPTVSEEVFPWMPLLPTLRQRTVTTTELRKVNTADGNSMFRAIALFLPDGFLDIDWQSDELAHLKLREIASHVLIQLMSQSTSDQEALANFIANQRPSGKFSTGEGKQDIATEWKEKTEAIVASLNQFHQQNSRIPLSTNLEEIFKSSIVDYAREMTAVDGARVGAGELLALAYYFQRPIAVIPAESLIKTGDWYTRVYIPDISNHKIPITREHWTNLWNHHNLHEPIVLFKELGIDHYQAVIGIGTTNRSLSPTVAGKNDGYEVEEKK